MRSVLGTPSAATTFARDMPGEIVAVPCAERAAACATMIREINKRTSCSSSDADALKDRLEQRKAIGGAEQGVDRALGVRHHAEHIAARAHDPRDVAHRAVRVVRLLRLERARGVAEDHLAFALESVERLVVGAVASVAVRDRKYDLLTALVVRGEHRLGRFDAQVDGRTDELERGVAQQRAGKQSRLAGDLKPVAEADHGPTALSVLHDLAHDRAEARDRAGAQVVAVAEAAGEDDDVTPLQVVILVPEVDRFLAERLDDGLKGVVVAVGARERDDAELHEEVTSAIS